MTEVVCADSMTAPQLRRMLELAGRLADAIGAHGAAYERLPGNTGTDIPIRSAAAEWKKKAADGVNRLAIAANDLTLPQLVTLGILDDWHCSAINTTWLLGTLPEVASVNAPAVNARKALEIEWSRLTGNAVPVVPADAASPPGSRTTTYLVVGGVVVTATIAAVALALSCRRPRKALRRSR